MTRRLVALGGCALVVALVVVVGILVTASAHWTAAEQAFVLAVNAAHAPVADGVALAINLVFSPPFAAAIVVLGFVGFLVARKGLIRALEFGTMVGGAWLGSEVVKLLVHRPRPDHSLLQHPLIIETTNSYPSGHTAFVASLALSLIVMARGWRWRPLVIAGGVLLTLLTAASRVYLGVHYPTDVIASMVYSSAAVAAISLVWSIGRSRAQGPLLPRTGSQPRTT